MTDQEGEIVGPLNYALGYDRGYDRGWADAKAQSPDRELLEALIVAHQQVDAMLAAMVRMDESFLPSKSRLWSSVIRRANLIKKHGGEL